MADAVAAQAVERTSVIRRQEVGQQRACAGSSGDRFEQHPRGIRGEVRIEQTVAIVIGC